MQGPPDMRDQGSLITGEHRPTSIIQVFCIKQMKRCACNLFLMKNLFGHISSFEYFQHCSQDVSLGQTKSNLYHTKYEHYSQPLFFSFRNVCSCLTKDPVRTPAFHSVQKSLVFTTQSSTLPASRIYYFTLTMMGVAFLSPWKVNWFGWL